jgi:hypothetical protein
VPNQSAGILVDEEFGTPITPARAFDPTFAKVLVRSDPEGDLALNSRQADGSG